MNEFPGDIYTEPSNMDVDTLKNVDRNTLHKVGEPVPNPIVR
jgi:hypothetical protein